MNRPMARLTRPLPPSPASRRVETGYVMLDLALIATLVGLALGLLWAPIPDRALPQAGRPPTSAAAQTL